MKTDTRLDRTADTSTRRRARWRRPAIVAREPLEVVAVACVPTPPGKTLGLCANPQS